MDALLLDTDAAEDLYDAALAAAADDAVRENMQAMRHFAQGYAHCRYEQIDGFELSRPDAALAFGYRYAAYKAGGGELMVGAYFDSLHA